MAEIHNYMLNFGLGRPLAFKKIGESTFPVIPAKAGIQRIVDTLRMFISSTPAFAGVTNFCEDSLTLRVKGAR